MRSKIVAMKDYREVPLEIPAFLPDEAALEKEMSRLQTPYITWQEGDAVGKGDMVTCSLRSSVARFQKDQVRFVAGMGMFQRQLEELSLGMQVGETVEAQLPEGSVSLKVTEVKKRVIPPLSDEMVESQGLEGVHTLADYRRYLLDQQLEQALNDACYGLVNQVEQTVLFDSEFILRKEDWKWAVNLELDRCRAIARQDGMVLEEMTPQQFEGNIPVKSYEELVAMTQDTCWDTLRCYLLGQAYGQEDGFAVDEAGYAAYLQEYCAMWHLTDEQARAAQTWEVYCFNQWSGHAYQVWRNYVAQQYRAKNKL
ncbi:MAG: hypothetical protein ACOYJZ_10110 [Acutalibacter sp.]|jgi:FKBP-type peptidyl-prolyl cis-trans isomerase (trigger factor)